jgi:hypothetical protein
LAEFLLAQPAHLNAPSIFFEAEFSKIGVGVLTTWKSHRFVVRMDAKVVAQQAIPHVYGWLTERTRTFLLPEFSTAPGLDHAVKHFQRSSQPVRLAARQVSGGSDLCLVARGTARCDA